MEVIIKSRVSMPKEHTIYEGDNRVDHIYIYLDRYDGNLDRSLYDCRLKIRYSDGNYNVIGLGKQVGDDVITYSERIDRNITRIAGEIECQPEFHTSDNVNVFHASPFVLTVQPSLQAYEALDTQILPGTIQQLESRLLTQMEHFGKDDYPIENSQNFITSGAIYDVLENILGDINGQLEELLEGQNGSI